MIKAESLPPSVAKYIMPVSTVPSSNPERPNNLIHTQLKDRMPMPDLPPHEIRQASITDKEIVNTAGHELNHAIVALKKGVGVESISVLRKGNILGQTRFSGLITADQFKVIAGAGAVSPFGGEPAKGFGMDLHIIDMVNGFSGGFKGLIISDAQMILSSVSSPVRKRAAEIIAYKKVVTGSMIGPILNQAAFEIALETDAKDLFSPLFDLQQEEENLKNQDDYTIVEYLTDGNYRLTQFNHGKETTILICPMCGGENGHSKYCKNNQNTKRSIFNIPSSKPTEMIPVEFTDFKPQFEVNHEVVNNSQPKDQLSPIPRRKIVFTFSKN